MLFGGIAVTYLSVIIPLAALILLLGLVLWLGYSYVRGYRSRVRKETQEAYQVVAEDFRALRDEMVRQIGMLEKANQSRELTREEMRIFRDLSRRLDHMEDHISSEIDDIEEVCDTDEKPVSSVEHDTLSRYQNDMARDRAPAEQASQSAPRPVVPRGHTVRIERA
jgi:DNA replication initiation complex subunit (GINS family)